MTLEGKKQYLKDIGANLHKGGQIDAFFSEARFKVLDNGRRWGKSLYASIEAIPYAFMKNKMVWIVAPTYELTKKVFREIYNYINPREFIWKDKGRCTMSKSELFIETNTGTQFVGKSADNPKSLVGEGVDLLIIDEAAMIPEKIWTEYLRPTLTDKKGRAIIISTPKGKNWFFHLYTRGQDQLFENYVSWKHPTWHNPFIDPEEIEEARKTLPERIFQQEYEAAFLDDTGGVFRGVRKNIRKTLREPKPGEHFFIGVDLAKYMDFTVITVLDEFGNLVYFDRFNQVDWSLQKQRIKSVYKQYPGKITIDSTGVGDPIYEDLRNESINIDSFKFNNSSKTDLINNLSLSIEQNKIHYEDIPVLINELEIYAYELTPSRNLKMNAPAGYHDDCVISLALAEWGRTNVAMYSEEEIEW